jgi:collagen type VII alpha
MRPILAITNTSIALVALLAGMGCGDSGTGGAGGATSSTGTSTTTSSSKSSSGSGSTTTGGTATASTGTGTMGCSGATPVALKVKNFLSWCSVTVGTTAASSAAEQTICVASGATVDVSAVANATFELGATPWHDTDGDTGNGEQGTITGTGQSASSAAKVTVMGTADGAWVCCQDAGMMDCPTTDQCP